MCRAAGVGVVYTAEPFIGDGSLTANLLKQLKRTMAAEYSRELSEKVSRAKRGLTAKGYWCGGCCAYGFRRQVVSPDGVPGQVLGDGERKGLQGHRIVLTAGPHAEVAIVRRIFREYALQGLRRARVARRRCREAAMIGRNLLFGVALGAPGLALADPCEGALPPPGAHFAGLVQYVGDGDSLCVGRSADPATWIEVRLADFYAPELHAAGGRQAKAALEAIAYGQPVQCRAGRRSYDRVVAQCTLGGASLGQLMRQSGVRQGGRGYR